jgi:CBS domain-containing protein
MADLSLHALTSDAVAMPSGESWFADPEDPALLVMTDFREHEAITVPADTQIDRAVSHMQRTGVRSAFVSEVETGSLLGMLTAYDVWSMKPMRHMLSAGVTRDEVTVRDLMLPIAAWRVVEVDDLERTTIGAVATMLADYRRTHVPVVETAANGAKRLRGILSAARVRRVLARFDTAAAPARSVITSGPWYRTE